MNYIRAAYVYSGYLDKVTADDLKILTHINIAFGLVKNGCVTVDHIREKLSAIENIRKMKPEIKIVLSVGGWGAGGFSEAASTDEGCRLFAKTAADIQREFTLDGIDIDWEYPAIDEAGITATPEDRENFTRMLRYLREELDNCKAFDGGRCLLTIAAGAGKYFADQSAELPVITEILDFISLMTYDLAKFDGYTGHHTNVYDPDSDDPRFAWGGASTVEYFHEHGVPYEKMVYGAAFYSRRFNEVKSNDNNGLHQPAGVLNLYGPGFTDLYYNYIDKNGWTRYWDDTAKSPWLFNGTDFITYEDEQSIAEKCEYIKKKGILGIMYWEHSCDETRKLINTIGDGLADD